MARGWRARLVILRRLAWIISILYLLRSITISVTTIPPPIIDCVPLLVDDARSMLRAIFGMISGERKECTDMVFSGHTIVLLISFLFWTKYARHWSFVVYSAIHTVVGIASVLLVRYHYTLDVVLAAVITAFVHHMYYRALDSAVRQRLAVDRRIRCNKIFGKDAFAGSGKNTHGSGFAYNRVASEDNAEFVRSNTEPINISSPRANFSAELGLGLAQEQVYSTVLTLTSNAPAQNTMTTLFEIPSGSDDIEKALGAALESDNLHSAGLLYDEDIGTYHQDMLLINRPLSKCLSATKAPEDNYEQILSILEQQIRQTERLKSRATKRMEWWSSNWVFYMGIGWIAYAAGFILYVWPERHAEQSEGFLFHLISVAIIPLVLYYGRIIIRAIGQRSVKKHERAVVELKKQLKDRLDELKKKTAFDTTKTLIDKYSMKDRQDDKTISPLDRQKQMEAKNRRQTVPNFGSPASQAESSAPTSPLAGRGVQRPMGFPQPLMAAGMAPRPNGSMLPFNASGVVKMPGRSSSVQPMESPGRGGSRPWLDKLVDQLVGDVGGADDRYALICRHCYAHNGLVLEEEINDIQYSCPKCGKFNPSLRALRLQSRVGSQQILRAAPAAAVHTADYSDYDNYTDYGSSEAEDNARDKMQVEVEDKSVQADVSAEFGTPASRRHKLKTPLPETLKLIDEDEYGEGGEGSGAVEEGIEEDVEEGVAGADDDNEEVHVGQKTPREAKTPNTTRKQPKETHAVAGSGIVKGSSSLMDASDLTDLPEPSVSSAQATYETPTKSGKGGSARQTMPHKRKNSKPKPVV
ncbi:hypothetical protein LPJ66_009358 [Kickxella alabastrina]|uniref:Uncharacterized protein n=1 Tax=Kickxella alabastrina TaxID=61397 RepID=A0ACC1I5Z9_9FUNG|nr:hypothetical protein LPJ66_009358 [Kickxella alabastrina]